MPLVVAIFALVPAWAPSAVGQPDPGQDANGIYESRRGGIIVTVNRSPRALVVSVIDGGPNECFQPGDRAYRLEGPGPAYRGRALLRDTEDCTVLESVGDTRGQLRREDGAWVLELRVAGDSARRINASRLTVIKRADLPPCVDGDGDGFSDEDEELAGSDPNAPDESLPIPPPRTWAPNYDADAVYDTELATPVQSDLWWAAATGALAAYRPYPVAAALLVHYLDNTGTPVRIDLDAMLNERASARDTIEAYVEREVAYRVRRVAQGNFTGSDTTFAFQDQVWQAGFTGGSFEEPNQWYIGLGSFAYQVTGIAEIAATDPPSIEIRYRIHLADFYDWEGLAGVDWVMARLHRAGLARDFLVTGRSSERAMSFDSIFLSDREQRIEIASRRFVRRLGGSIKARPPCGT